jgi:hypothetical protein
MANYNENDDYIHRLGKFVPIYVLGWIASIESLLQNFTGIMLVIAFSIVAGIAIVLVYVNEFRAIMRDPKQKITDNTQRTILVVSTGLYLFSLLYRSILISVIVDFLGQQMADQINLLFVIIVLGYTFIIPWLVKKSPPSTTPT